MLKIFLSKIKKAETDDQAMEEDKKSDDSEDEGKNISNNKFDIDDEETGTIEVNDEQRNEIITTVLPEIMAGYSSHQLKSQRLSESLLLDLVKVYANHFNDFLKKLLAGLAGATVETRASTIQILTKVLKSNPKDFSEANLLKITNISVLFMKEKSVYVQRVVLKLLKRITSMLSSEALEPVSSKIIESVIDCDAKKKLNLRIKYVISNLIRKVGKDKIKEITPEEHKALIDYCYSKHLIYYHIPFYQIFNRDEKERRNTAQAAYSPASTA